MLHRVVMDIVDMRLQIPLVPDQMLPVATLPDTSLAFRGAARAHALAFGNATREACLDKRPARRVVHIARRQLPDGMQMIREQHHGHDLKRMTEPDRANDLAQAVRLIGEQGASTVRQRHGEEIRTAGNVRAPNVRSPSMSSVSLTISRPTMKQNVNAAGIAPEAISPPALAPSRNPDAPTAATTTFPTRGIRLKRVE